MDAARVGTHARHAKERMTSGYILPLEPTKQGRFPWWLLWGLPGFIVSGYIVAHEEQLEENPYGNALWMFALAFVSIPLFFVPTYLMWSKGPRAAKRGVVQVRLGAQALGEELHAHGWPTWRDAWGIKGHRPGGAGRGVLRGYIRFFTYGVLPLAVLGAFSGGDGLAGGVVLTILFGVPALIACGWLYQFRCTDFDPWKGLTFGVAFYMLLRVVLPIDKNVSRSFTPTWTER